MNGYQSEYALENEVLQQLESLGYERVYITLNNYIIIFVI